MSEEGGGSIRGIYDSIPGTIHAGMKKHQSILSQGLNNTDPVQEETDLNTQPETVQDTITSAAWRCCCKGLVYPPTHPPHSSYILLSSQCTGKALGTGGGWLECADRQN